MTKNTLINIKDLFNPKDNGTWIYKHFKTQQPMKILHVNLITEVVTYQTDANEIFVASIFQDMDGEAYFMHENKAQYLTDKQLEQTMPSARTAAEIAAKIDDLEAKKPNLFKLQDEALKRYQNAKKDDPYTSPRQYYEACDQLNELQTMIKTLKWVIGQ